LVIDVVAKYYLNTASLIFILKIHTFLDQTISNGVDRLDAQLLLLFCLGKSQSDRAWLIAHDKTVISATQAKRFSELCQQRLAGIPLAYLVGEKPFFGINLQVDPRVLIPRPDTETLVEWALGMPSVHKVLDLGTGSGAIALALKSTQPNWEITAIDKSADALMVASSNAKRLGLDIEFVQSAWFDALQIPTAPNKYDLIVSNPPYIALNDPHLGTLTHEPTVALVSGPDGLDDLRHIIQKAPTFLNNHAWLLLEHGYDQAAKVRDLLQLRGFTQVQSKCDLAGIERCSGGQWLASHNNMQGY